MKKRHSSKAPLAQLHGEPFVHRIQGAAFPGWDALGGGGFGDNGHQAAGTSMARGLVYFPEFDTKKEISSFTRLEILRKARFLYANCGFPRRIVNGISRMVAGTGLIPRFKTADKEWNTLALEAVNEVFRSAPLYDIAGKLTFYRAQRAKLRCRYKDGDVLTVLTRDKGRACTAIYEGHQIGSGRLAAGEEKTVFDGVRVNEHNRVQDIRLLHANGNDFTSVPAPSALLLADFERIGQNRSVSILAHACNALLDKTELDHFWKGSLKNAARVGYYIGSAKDTVPSTTPKPGAGARRTVTLANGEKVNLDQVYSSNGGEVPQLQPGQELKMLLDERPHPNNMAFMDYMVRDISLGVDLAPEVLYNIAQLGGANVRYVMQGATSFVEQEQQTLVDTDLGPELLYFVADAMASGRLRPCRDPKWWKHDWITPARETVDIGKDGKLRLEQLKSGAITFRRYFGEQGLGLDELEEWMDEVKMVWEGAKRRFPGDKQMLQFILGALYQRVGLASVLDDVVTTAAEDAAAAAEEDKPTGGAE